MGGDGPVTAWSEGAIPAPASGCPDESVPDFVPLFENPGGGPPIASASLQIRFRELKSPSFFWNRMNWWQHEFRDRAALKRMILGELGGRLEISVHNQMHIRWTDYPSNGWRLVRGEDDFRPKCNDIGYDTLMDEYSSHVNPLFFRLHVWIDERINDWAEAHGREVERYPTPQGFEWFRPGRWVEVAQPWPSPYGLGHAGSDEAARIKVMLAVAAALFRNAAQIADPEGKERQIRSLRDLAL